MLNTNKNAFKTKNAWWKLHILNRYTAVKWKNLNVNSRKYDKSNVGRGWNTHTWYPVEFINHESLGGRRAHIYRQNLIQLRRNFRRVRTNSVSATIRPISASWVKSVSWVKNFEKTFFISGRTKSIKIQLNAYFGVQSSASQRKSNGETNFETHFRLSSLQKEVRTWTENRKFQNQFCARTSFVNRAHDLWNEPVSALAVLRTTEKLPFTG